MDQHTSGTIQDPTRSIPPGRISGTCRTPAGGPVPGLRVNVYSPDDIIIDTQVTDARGRFTTRLLFAGVYRVEVRGGTAFGPAGSALASRRCEVRLGEVSRLDFTVGAPPSAGH